MWPDKGKYILIKQNKGKLELVYFPKGKYCAYPQMVYRLAIAMPSSPPPPILDDRKSLSIAFLAISDQYATFFFEFFLICKINTQLFFSQNGCLKSLSIAFIDISDQYATFCIDLFFKMAAGGHFGSPIWAILDDRKSLSIAFFAISDQYTTFVFLIFFQNGRRRPFWKSD